MQAAEKRRNKISKLKKANGDFTESKQEMRDVTREFYRNLFHWEGVHNMEAVLGTVPVKVMPEMNDKLLMPFTGLEVKEALFQMFPTKAPGPDGSRHIFPATLGSVWSMKQSRFPRREIHRVEV